MNYYIGLDWCFWSVIWVVFIVMFVSGGLLGVFIDFFGGVSGVGDWVWFEIVC